MKRMLSFILSIMLVFSLFSVNTVALEISNDSLSNSIIGDVDGNGKIGAADVTLLRRYLAGGFNISINTSIADADNNGEIDAQDVTCIRNIIAGGWNVLSDDIIILFTNDVHCGVDDNIGYSGLAAYKKYCETITSNVALVDCGDAIQGDIVGAVSKGEYIVDIMNEVGYDIAIFGNHEFDFGMEQLEYLVEKSNAEYIASNITYTGKGDSFINDIIPNRMLTFGDVDVAFIGVSTPYTIASGTPKHFMENGEFVYDFKAGDGTELYECVQKNIDECIEKGAEYVILLTHLGETEEYDPYSSVNIIENTKNVDVVLDAHQHSVIPCDVYKNIDGEDVLLASTGTKLNNIGQLKISSDGEIEVGLISNYEEKDSEMDAFIENLMSGLEEELNTVIGQSEVNLTGYDENGIRLVRNRETNVGNFCTDAYRIVADADVAFVNGGGIRADIAIGNVTYANLISIHPYGNTLCMVEATGQEILDALEISMYMVKGEYESNGVALGENGSFLQSSGIKFTVDTSIESTVEFDEYGMVTTLGDNRRVCNVEILNDDGTYSPIDVTGTYKVASHNYFLLDGGSGHNIFSDNKILLDRTIADYEVLITYIAEYLGGVIGQEYSQTEGRIEIK